MIQAGATTWLALWERLVPSPPRQRRRELLAAAGGPGEPAPGQLEVGKANARLLRLHLAMFGPRLACRTACPSCGVALELDLDAPSLLAQAPTALVDPVRVQRGAWEVAFRLPTEGDLDALQGEGDPEVTKNVLLQRCVIECRHGSESRSIVQAPPEVAVEIGSRMEAGDPLAAIDFELRCDGCGSAWSSALEVDSFVWTRLDAWVRRLLQDVHSLARVYGWSEEAIAAMSPWKRQIYLDMVGG